MCEDLTARPRPFQTALRASGGYLCAAPNVAGENVFECAIIQLCDISKKKKKYKIEAAQAKVVLDEYLGHTEVR